MTTHQFFAQIDSWLKQGKPVALATLVQRDGVSLRPLGAKMAMSTSFEMIGSISGGCVEGAIYEEAQTVLRQGSPRLVSYGATEGRPWEVGLSCGSRISVLIESLHTPHWRPVYPVLIQAIQQEHLVAMVTVIQGEEAGRKMLIWSDGRTMGHLGNASLDAEVVQWARRQLSRQESAWRTFEQTTLFVDVFSPPPRLIIIGGVHIAISLVALAKVLGFFTIVIDPRSAFLTRERFPQADQLLQAWPQDVLPSLNINENTFLVALSHDEKLDHPALQIGLSSPACYVGVLGSRKTIPKRLADLRERGVSEQQLSRLRAPVGLPLGAIEPEEIALSILAEMVTVRRGHTQPFQKTPFEGVLS